MQHFPECHGAAGGGTLAKGDPGWGGTLEGVPWLGGTLVGGDPGWGGTLEGVPWLGGTLVGGYPGRGYPGGYPGRGGTLAGGYPGWGGTQLGQHREYLLHGGRYASCVHAGGLSCSFQNVRLYL